MQTQCPHCETLFRVTETQISIADGYVRCSICKKVFNALKVKPEKTDLQTAQDTAHKNGTGEHTKIQPDNKTVDLNEIAATDGPTEETFDFFDEQVNESLPHVVPDKFRDSYSAPSQSIISTVLWSIAILLLTATLFIEYVWFNRDQFNQIPELQAVIENLCQQVECKDISVRDASKIELVTRNVYSHPNEKNALMVSVTMKNNADFAQPYPVMQIDFSDIRGGIIVARRFLPTEYLPIDFQQIDNKHRDLFQPGTSTKVTLEIQDPGKQAKTYEFNFL